MINEKFLIVFAVVATWITLAGAQDTFDWSSVPENDKLNCLLKPNKLFSCRGADGIIECPAGATNQFDASKFKSMGIGRCERNIEQTDLVVKVCLFPSNNSQSEIDIGKNYTIFYSNRTDLNQTFGIRISELKCYEKMYAFFENASRSVNDDEDGMDITTVSPSSLNVNVSVSSVSDEAMNQLVETYAAASQLFGEMLSYDGFLLKKRFNHVKKHNHAGKRSAMMTNMNVAMKAIKMKRHNHHKRNVMNTMNMMNSERVKV